MKIRHQTLLELRKLNTRLDQLSANNRYFVYSANPAKFAFYNFIAGVFHSLGTLFGTLFLTAAILYVFSQLNIDIIGPTTKFLEDSFGRIDWNKIVPAPAVDVNQFKLNQ